MNNVHFSGENPHLAYDNWPVERARPASPPFTVCGKYILTCVQRAVRSRRPWVEARFDSSPSPEPRGRILTETVAADGRRYMLVRLFKRSGQYLFRIDGDSGGTPQEPRLLVTLFAIL